MGDTSSCYSRTFCFGLSSIVGGGPSRKYVGIPVPSGSKADRTKFVEKEMYEMRSHQIIKNMFLNS